MPTLRWRTGRDRKSSPPKRTSPVSGCSRPASTRSSVVLPEPDGPSRARNSLSRACSDTSFSAGKRPNCLEIPRISRARVSSVFAAGGKLPGVAPFEDGLEDKRDDPEAGENGCRRECADGVIVIVEHLDVKRQSVGQAADVAGDHGNRAELTHRARIAEQDAVEQRPLDVGQGDPPEGGEAAGAQGERR